MLKKTPNREEKLTGIAEDDEKIGRLSTDTLKYFQRVEQVLDDNVFDDEEHKDTFMRNVFNEMQTDGTHLSRHSQKTSRIIEKIIPCLDGELFGKFTVLLEGEIDMLSCDRFASHVIETLCRCSVTHTKDEATSEIFVKFCRVLRKKCDTLLRDTYGSHVLSTVLQVLSGVRVPEVLTKSKASRNVKKKKNKFKGFVQTNKSEINEPVVTDVPRLFRKCFKKYVQVIRGDINFGELLCHRNASPVLQVLLLATSKVSGTHFLDLYESIVSRGKLMEVPQVGGDIQDDEELAYRLPVVFTDEIGSHLFEAVIRSATSEQLHALGDKCFKRCILSMCVHPLANYLVQTYLKYVEDTEHVDFFITRLLNYIEDILAAGSMAIVVRVAELIIKYAKVEYQKKLITTLCDVLHIPENCSSKPLCKLLLCMKTYDLMYKQEESTKEAKNDGEVEDGNHKDLHTNCVKESPSPVIMNDDISYHGCCLLKNLFLFKKSKLVVESFLQLSAAEVRLIACHPNGSFAIEAFFQSEWIPNKSKSCLAEMFFGSIEEIASNKWGSRVVDAIYKGIDDSLQERLKFVLRKHKSRLESDLYGRIVLYNCGVKQYVDKMRKVEEQREKKRKLFEGIIGENVTDTKKVVAVVPLKKKKKDDRATKYRKQLETLGISYADEGENQGSFSDIMTSVEKESVKDLTTDPSDDLSDVLLAIEASVTQKHKRKGLSL